MAEDTKRKTGAKKASTHAFPKSLFPPVISGLASSGISAPTVPLIPLRSNANFGAARNPAIANPAALEPVYGSADQSLDPAVNLASLNPEFQNIVLDPIVPTPPSSVDPQALLAQALQRRAQQAAMDVELRKQQQLEQGVGGSFGDGRYLPDNTYTSSKYITENVPSRQLDGFERDENGIVSSSHTKVVPGIGHVTDANQKDGGEGRIMTGRYGTGTATFSDKPRTTGGTITEDGQKVPIASWFNDAARRQGESNQFFNKAGRKIVPDKVA